MLDPSKRITANEALEHPFVAAVRDRSEELECKEIFDFESFEMIQSEHVLRQCIVEEVMSSKGLMVDPFHPHFSSSSFSGNQRRRYTGGSLSTPSSASTAGANMAAQQGKEIVQNNSNSQAQYVVMNPGQIVGEPEDMDEDDIKLMGSDDGIVPVDRRRTLVGPINANFQEIERQLSRDR
jgi:mitogen-activated protein kinase 7